MPQEQSPLTSTNTCAVCGETVVLGDTAVAVIGPDGKPTLVHPGCYPRFALMAKARPGGASAEPRSADRAGESRPE
jgi:hypothetical protein